MIIEPTREVELVLPYSLKPWQVEVDLDPHRFKVIVAGRRSGKTTLALDQLVTGAVEDTEETLSLYVGLTYTSAEDVAWTKLKQMIDPFRRAGFVRRIYEGDLSIELMYGQWIQLKGGDKPESLRGLKVRRAVLDEYAFMKREVWDEVIQPATADYAAPVWFIGSPCGYNHFYELAQMETTNPAAWKTWHIKTAEAGTIPREEIERARRDMDPRVFRQELEASFESFGGQVFTDFDRKTHVTKAPFGHDPKAEYALGMDFGWSSPCAVLFANITADETLNIFAELGRRETAIPVICDLIRKVVPDRMPSLIGCDPAGDAKNEAAGTSSVKEMRAVFGQSVVRYKAKYPGCVQDRTNLIRKWLRNRKLNISPACKNLIQALEMYRYPDPKNGIQSEEPLKDGVSDHWVDALGELMVNRFPIRKATWGVM